MYMYFDDYKVTGRRIRTNLGQAIKQIKNTSLKLPPTLPVRLDKKFEQQ